MDEALDSWRKSHQIDELAFSQLLDILLGFGLSNNHATINKNHAEVLWTESNPVWEGEFHLNGLDRQSVSHESSRNKFGLNNLQQDDIDLNDLELNDVGPNNFDLNQLDLNDFDQNVFDITCKTNQSGLDSDISNISYAPFSCDDYLLEERSNEVLSGSLRHTQGGFLDSSIDEPDSYDLYSNQVSKSAPQSCDSIAGSLFWTSSKRQESVPVSRAGARNGIACIRCWKRKKRCTPNTGICGPCLNASIPPQVCVRARFIDELVFSKWQDGIYQSKLDWQHLYWTSEPRSVVLCHEWNGPTIGLFCRQFKVASPEQTKLYFKVETGWKCMCSTPFALYTFEVTEFDAYISNYALFYLETACYDGSWLGQIFRQAKGNAKDHLISLALNLWAANCMLMKGWGIRGHDTLGMSTITDQKLCDTTPAPRVLQNQLDRNLESYIARTELQLLRELQKAMLHSRLDQWITVFTVVVITLHVRERDLWRLEHWVLNPNASYEWRHPDTAATLIGRSIHSSNLLLYHLRLCGEIPRQFFSIEQSVASQRIEKPRLRYQWGDARSIDYALSALAFECFEDKNLKLAKAEDFGC